MPWLKISVDAAGASAQALSERMLACGALSVSFHKATAIVPHETTGCVPAAAGALPKHPRQSTQGPADGLGASEVLGDEVLEPPPGSVPLWPRVTVSGLFPPAVNVQALNSALGETGASPTACRIEWLGDQDWVVSPASDVPELRFGDRLAVVSRNAPPRLAQATTALPSATLRLDPGLAFGTGQHPTTRSCLAWLADARLAGASVLDYGCGSGILGIAAALLGATRVMAVDVEPQALAAAQANARFNGVTLDAVTAPEAFLPQPEFDVVLANILANTLIELAPTLSGCLKAGGQLILAGLLAPQIHAVAAAFPNLAFDPPAMEGEWARLTGRQRG